MKINMPYTYKINGKKKKNSIEKDHYFGDFIEIDIKEISSDDTKIAIKWYNEDTKENLIFKTYDNKLWLRDKYIYEDKENIKRITLKEVKEQIQNKCIKENLAFFKFNEINMINKFLQNELEQDKKFFEIKENTQENQINETILRSKNILSIDGEIWYNIENPFYELKTKHWGDVFEIKLKLVNLKQDDITDLEKGRYRGDFYTLNESDLIENVIKEYKRLNLDIENKLNYAKIYTGYKPNQKIIEWIILRIAKDIVESTFNTEYLYQKTKNEIIDYVELRDAYNNNQIENIIKNLENYKKHETNTIKYKIENIIKRYKSLPIEEIFNIDDEENINTLKI